MRTALQQLRVLQHAVGEKRPPIWQCLEVDGKLKRGSSLGSFLPKYLAPLLYRNMLMECTWSGVCEASRAPVLTSRSRAGLKIDPFRMGIEGPGAGTHPIVQTMEPCATSIGALGPGVATRMTGAAGDLDVILVDQGTASVTWVSAGVHAWGSRGMRTSTRALAPQFGALGMAQCCLGLRPDSGKVVQTPARLQQSWLAYI